jgi:microcystin-dependent protein
MPYIGEIRMFAGNFAPAGWAFCDGSVIPISENDVLFYVIGTTYGGDGQQTFALPDLQGRVPVHIGSSFPLGDRGGVESVTLILQQIPGHNHAMLASNDPSALQSPSGNVTGQAASKIYRAGTPSTYLNSAAVALTGGNMPHENFQPYLCVNFIIALYGTIAPTV